MTVLRPVLLLIVPGGWDVVPEAVAELRRCLADDYGGTLMLRQATTLLRSPLMHYCGYWEPGVMPFARRDVPPRVQDAFIDLAWAELDEVG
ncbi:hypothetical protein E7T09_03990 [Deinococcus sp. KSM4-11]|uniref:hypothetical protein n=1 Tax=Deinococcus sp. KSM4-11 TaxID=2568654 RepID=UPI0010A36696|nr:hypothetical protein [Deinococcus sp. KSM4-11]THF88374.1 hypothetical protein E7T09_03990 [Deinococcus sp. KSM4-11]